MASRSWIAAAALVLIAGAALAQAPAAARKVLQRTDAAAGQEAVQGTADFPPGAETGMHTHPGAEMDYVSQGRIEVVVPGQPAKTYGQGEYYLIPRGGPHNVRNAGTVPAQVVATWIVDKGAPMTTPVN